jgi:hypothetical protein
MRHFIFAIAIFAAACSDKDADPVAPDAAAAPDAPPAEGGMCGGLAGLACEDSEYCAHDAHSCGTPDAAGTCWQRPVTCDSTYQPVCGCNGMVYSNECMANLAGEDVSRTVACEPPSGTMRCGYLLCDKTDSCSETGPEEDPVFACVPAP